MYVDVNKAGAKKPGKGMLAACENLHKAYVVRVETTKEDPHDVYGSLRATVYFADGKQMFVPKDDTDRFTTYNDLRNETCGPGHAKDMDSKVSYKRAAHGRDLAFRGPVGNIFVWCKTRLDEEGKTVRVKDEIRVFNPDNDLETEM